MKEDQKLAGQLGQHNEILKKTKTKNKEKYKTKQKTSFF
jgi:hypothetical protein